LAETKTKKKAKASGGLTTSAAAQKRAEQLTEMQKRFCAALVENNYQKKKAAIAAGAKEKTAQQQASKWLSMVKVRRYVNQLQKEQLQAMCLSEDRVLVELLRVYERAAANGAHASELRALELIGKSMGMFAEKQVILDEPLRDDGFIGAIAGQAGANWAGGGDAVGGSAHAA